jgi:hypothetical protein
MGRHKNKLASLLTGITVLASFCSWAGSSAVSAQAQLALDTTITSGKPDAANLSLLSQTKINESEGSISYSEDSNSSYLLLKDSPPVEKTSSRPDIRFWYGQYFSSQELRVLSACPFECEPNRVGLKISFAF